MKTIIAGPRDFLDFQFVKKTIQESGFIITEVVSGCAKGVDWMGEYWAALNGIPVKRFPAQWEYRGKAAGPIRNQVMVDYAKAAIIIVGGRGSRDCWMKAKKGKNHPSWKGGGVEVKCANCGATKIIEINQFTRSEYRHTFW